MKVDSFAYFFFYPQNQIMNGLGMVFFTCCASEGNENDDDNDGDKA